MDFKDYLHKKNDMMLVNSSFSVFGQPVSTSGLGTTVGGALGSVIPGVGTAAGGAIGGLLGGLFGGTQTCPLTEQMIKDRMTQELSKYYDPQNYYIDFNSEGAKSFISGAMAHAKQHGGCSTLDDVISRGINTEETNRPGAWAFIMRTTDAYKQKIIDNAINLMVSKIQTVFNDTVVGGSQNPIFNSFRGYLKDPVMNSSWGATEANAQAEKWVTENMNEWPKVLSKSQTAIPKTTTQTTQQNTAGYGEASGTTTGGTAIPKTNDNTTLYLLGLLLLFFLLSKKRRK